MKYLTTYEAVDKTGLHERTLQRLCKELPVGFSSTGRGVRNVYSSFDVEVLRRVKRLRDLGLGYGYILKLAKRAYKEQDAKIISF